MKGKIIGTLLGAVLLALGATTNAQAATVLDGNGYDLDGGIHYLSTTDWTVEFYDTYSRDHLASYMKTTTAELHARTGLTYRVSSVIRHSTDPCQKDTYTGHHVILVRLTSTVDRSSAYMCNLNGEAWGSYVRFASYRWYHQTRGGTHTAYRRNVVSHELGHVMGLGHAKPEYLTGTDPLMSGNHWGGYWWISAAQKYTPYDVAGLHRLVANRP